MYNDHDGDDDGDNDDNDATVLNLNIDQSIILILIQSLRHIYTDSSILDVDAKCNRTCAVTPGSIKCS